MRKELRFSSIIDTKDFDAAIERMQKKLQDMYRQVESSRTQFENKQKAAGLGLGPAPTASDKTRLDQEERRSRTEMDRFIKSQIKDGEVISRELNKQLQARKELLKISQQDAEAKKKLADLEKQISITREKQRLNEGIVKQALDQRLRMGGDASIQEVIERAINAYAGARAGGASFLGGIGAAGTGLGRGLAQSNLALGTLVSSLGAGVIGSGQVVSAGLNFFATDRARREEAKAQAVQNFSSPLMSVLRQGQMEEMFFAQERAEALRMARKQIKLEKASDVVSLGTKLLGSGLVAGGGALGLSLGLSKLGIGAALGLAPISLPLALLAGAGGLGFMAWRNREALGGYLTGTRQAQFEAKESAQGLANFENLINQNPLKRYALEQVRARTAQRLPTQQALGLSDSAINNLIIGGTEYGFTEPRTLQAMSNIMSAGGGTAVSRELATFSNILNRAGIMNASSLIGKIGGIDISGSPQTVQSTFMKMFSEAVKLGLDSSEYARESNKYFENLTQYFSKIGAQTVEGRSIIAEQFGLGGMVSKSMAGVSALMESRSVAMGNEKSMIGTAIRMASLESDSGLAGLSEPEKISIAQMSSDEIRALKGTRYGDYLERKTGMKIEDIAIKVGSTAQTGPFPQFDKALEAYQKAIESGDQEKISDAFGKVFSAGMALVPGFSESSVLGREQFIEDQNLERIRRKAISLGEESLTEGEKKALEKFKLRPPPDLVTNQAFIDALRPQKLGEKIEADRAISDAASIQVMKSFSEEIEKSLTPLGSFTDNLKKATEILIDFISKEKDVSVRREAIDYLIELRQPQTRAGKTE